MENPGFPFNKRTFDLVIHPGIADVLIEQDNKMAILSSRHIFTRNVLLDCIRSAPIYRIILTSIIK